MGISSIAFALNPYPYSVFNASENRCEAVRESVGKVLCRTGRAMNMMSIAAAGYHSCVCP
jgi:hypothetical protein